MIETVEELEAYYGSPKPASTRKVANRIVPVYRRWIMASRFCVLTTVGPEGADGSPRGDEGPVVQEIDDQTLALPDWKGNDRIDSLRNIVRDPRVSLMFMVPGSSNVVRVIGKGAVTVEPDMLERFARGDVRPRSVILLKIDEIYFQCSRAILRSRLWSSGDESGDLPTPGEILKEMTHGEVGGPAYDAEWPARASQTMW